MREVEPHVGELDASVAEALVVASGHDGVDLGRPVDDGEDVVGRQLRLARISGEGDGEARAHGAHHDAHQRLVHLVGRQTLVRKDGAISEAEQVDHEHDGVAKAEGEALPRRASALLGSKLVDHSVEALRDLALCHEGADRADVEDGLGGNLPAHRVLRRGISVAPAHDRLEDDGHGHHQKRHHREDGERELPGADEAEGEAQDHGKRGACSVAGRQSRHLCHLEGLPREGRGEAARAVLGVVEEADVLADQCGEGRGAQLQDQALLEHREEDVLQELADQTAEARGDEVEAKAVEPIQHRIGAHADRRRRLKVRLAVAGLVEAAGGIGEQVALDGEGGTGEERPEDR
mmetsp:Transcript_96762/g.312944  ORF Transcript_96762/g.312944 Transcript_96762/m.312944 type:complete len:348 (+) Transcript_96762:805-1848(+)